MTPNCTRLALLVSSDLAHSRLLGAVAGRHNWRLLNAADAESALATLGTRDGMMLDAILIDMADSAALQSEIAERRPALPVLIVAESITHAVAGLRLNATDYLLKPVSADHVFAALERALTTTTLGELRPLSESASVTLNFGEIVGSDPAFRTALAVAAKAARARMPLLIEGPSGAGKDLLARAIHAASPRAKKPLVHVDCARASPTQIESELFGHAKGAFAGAFDQHVGKALHAEGGTLVIQGLEHLSHEMQVKLLRLIDDGGVQPLGSERAFHLDVRVIATSQQPLLAATKTGRFREDLYYRLNTVHIKLPPLRARLGDVPMLTAHLLQRNAQLPNIRALPITDAAMQLLNTYHWPGNVRQLQNVLLRAVLDCDTDMLTAADFPTLAAQSQITARTSPQRALASGVTIFEPDGHLRTLAEIEADIIRLAIGHYRGRMTEVARRLGIGRSTLYRKLEELGLSDVA